MNIYNSLFCDSDFDNTHYFIVTKLYYNCFGIN